MGTETVTVLHVDDDPAFGEVAKAHLERCDASLAVVTESSATDGLEQLARRSVDCVVSDYDMPDMNGLDFLRAVRDEYADLPFVLYTGKGSEEIAEEAINAGVDAYYQKETGVGQYAVIARHITTLADRHSAKRRLDYLERKQHITDGGVRPTDRGRADGDDESVSIRVVGALAAREGVDPVALTPPLYESVDPEALDGLFPQGTADAGRAAESVTFTHLGYTVTVSGDGQIRIDD